MTQNETKAPLIELPHLHYDIVGSIVLFNTAPVEVMRAIEQFLAIPLRVHLCIIDNSPTRADFIPIHSDVTYVFAGENLGYGRAHNLALRAARNRADYNLIMNTDVQYLPDAVVTLRESLESDRASVLAAPRMLYPDRTLQCVCRLLPTPQAVFLRRFLGGSRWAKRADHDYELRFWDHSTRANVPNHQGSFLMVRTDVCNRIGGFDERFFMYAEDFDLSRRLHREGATMFIPEAEVIHEYRRAAHKSWRATFYAIINIARYFMKWGWIFDAERERTNARVRRALRND